MSDIKTKTTKATPRISEKNAMLVKVLLLATKEQIKDLATAKTYSYTVENKEYTIFDGEKTKVCVGPDYNYLFCKTTGDFKRFGVNYKDDPQFSPIGPEIADIEITTSCLGVPNRDGVKAPCIFCYKSNTANGTYMTLETFKKVFANLPHNVGQIAFGLDSECKTNPEWFEIFKYARDNGVIPNVTVANIDDETADKLASICGAIAVSRYDNKDICYNTVKKLTDRGMKQINIHHLAAMESYDNLMETLADSKTDPRLAKLNAIVILSLKKCGRGTSLNSLPQEKFAEVIKYSFDNNVRIGFDSCSCHKFLASISNMKEEIKKKLEMVSEPCESLLFSSYFDVEGKLYPCSFCENIKGWEDGVDMKIPLDFIKNVWNNSKVIGFRDKLIKNNRNCPIYKV